MKDKLASYNKKRNFKHTSEPKGRVFNSNNKRFVVQYHEARAKHYDFRLEYDGVLISWAIPKGFSFDTSVKRLAVKVEDHPLDYINFEGVIPKGNYGAGTVQIFDSGTYQPLQDFDFGLEKGHIKFVLYGNILKGSWQLFKTDQKNWLLTKMKDENVEDSDLQILPHKNPFKSCSVQLATLVSTVPSGKKWIFEIKYDGYRMVAYGEKGKVKLLSRNNVDYTKKFSALISSLQNLAKKYTFVLDGEVVAFDDNGKSDFSLLQERIKSGKGGINYVVFDILAFQGKDLRSLSLLERKNTLQKLLPEKNGNILPSSFVFGEGKKCFALAKKLNLEGIVAKDTTSAYNGTRDETWLKIKCRKRQEFVVVGWTKTEKNPILSALILAVYEKGNLVFVGKVGTGFNDQIKKELQKKLQKIKTSTSPLSQSIKLKNVVWVKPLLVAEVEYAELTKDNILRQPSFIALRTDKNPQSVVLEVEK